MVKGYEYFVAQEAQREKTRTEILSSSQSDASFSDYEKMKRIVKTVWMLYAIFVFLSLVSALIVSKYKPDKFAIAFEVWIIGNIVLSISVLCVTKILVNKKKEIYMDKYKKTCEESASIQEQTKKLAQIAMLSLTLNLNDDIKSDEDLIKRTNEKIEQIQKDAKNNLTDEDLIQIYKEYVNKKIE